MSSNPAQPVLTFDLGTTPLAVRVLDRVFRLPEGRSLSGRDGKIDWAFFARRGETFFGKPMPFFYTQEQFQASLERPDKQQADACEAARNTQKGCILPIGKDNAGLEWGTNFTHFTYKSTELANIAVQFAGNLLGFRNCNKQSHFFYYPEGGYREWHTNEGSPQPGWRIYLIKTSAPGKSFFSYLDQDQLVNSPDQRYTLRVFRFGGGLNFYHSVTSVAADRFSYGIRPNDWPFESIQQAQLFLTDRLQADPLPAA